MSCTPSTGCDYAYKIEKPLDLGFLDYRTLAKRRHYCEEELRLNRPWAPDIYLDVVAVTRTADGVTVGGDGTPLEYAVRMQRFDQARRLDNELAAGRLTADDMRAFAGTLAARHREARRTPAADRARIVRRAIELVRENFPPLERAVPGPLLDELRQWTTRELRALGGTFRRRFDDGWFRECHGDLHLGNLVRLPGGITAFDCIEFNDELRNTDVVADVAFLVMDLVSRRRRDLAAHFLNRYLEHTGDYAGMRLLNLYFTYRCLVRAKVAVIRSGERRTAAERTADLDEAGRYLRLARERVAPRVVTLIAMHGLSGSGKTWVSERLMACLPAIRIRSDIERKRLFGVAETASSESGIAAGIYASRASARTYARLHSLAECLLAAGHNVILDAAYLRRGERSAAAAAAARAGAAFLVVTVCAREAVLRQRICERQQLAGASEADLQVLDYQLRNAEPLTPAERAFTVACRSDRIDSGRLAQRIRRRAARSSASASPH